MEFPEFYTEELIEEIIKRAEDSPIDENKYIETMEHLSFLAEYLHSLAITIDKSLYDLKPRRVAYGVLMSAKFNAFSYSSEEAEDKEPFDFIGINSGALCILFDNFTHILSSPWAFVGYGNCQNEEADRSTIMLRTTANRNDPFVLPKCPLRLEFAKTLTIIAAQFLLMHEATHLRNGHTDWKRKAEGSSVLQEALPSSNEAVKDPIIRHALEIDADLGALIFSLEHCFGIMERLDTHREKFTERDLEVCELAFGSRERVVRTVLYAVYVMFRCTDPRPWDEGSSLLSGTHPRVLVRARHLALKLIDIIQSSQFASADKNSLIDFAFYIIREAEQDIARIVGRPHLFNDFVDSIKSQRAIEHLDTVTAAYRDLKSQLEPFIRGGRLPD